MLYFWILFNVFALGMLVLDLTVFHRPGRPVGFRSALVWTAFYVILALVFALTRGQPLGLGGKSGDNQQCRRQNKRSHGPNPVGALRKEVEAFANMT